MNNEFHVFSSFRWRLILSKHTHSYIIYGLGSQTTWFATYPCILWIRVHISAYRSLLVNTFYILMVSHNIQSNPTDFAYLNRFKGIPSSQYRESKSFFPWEQIRRFPLQFTLDYFISHHSKVAWNFH